MTPSSSRLGAIAAVLIAVIGFPHIADAGPVGDQVSEAEALVASGDSDDAMLAYDEATDAFWELLPLHLRTMGFVTEARAFGQYEPRNSTFRSGDTATVYMEPVGYGFLAAGDLQQASFSTALTIRTPGGLILAESEDFGKLIWEGRSKSREVPLSVSVPLPALKPGQYELDLRLTDDASGDMATGTLSFVIVE